jgi:ParB/RepB/Spo0J family partition protein
MAQTTLKSIAESSQNMFLIPYENLQVEDGFNVREDYGDIDELAKSLAENGQLQPLTVRLGEDKKAVVIDGHRRMKALSIAVEKYDAKELKAFWCIQEKPGSNAESRIFDLFTRNSGKPLTPIEQAAAVKRLIDYNWKVADISKKIGKTRIYVNNILNLNAASKEIRDTVKNGVLSPTAAVKLSQAPKAKQESVLLKISTLCSDPTGENKANKTDSKDGTKPKKKLSVAEIEKEVKGEATMISAKSIKDKIKLVNETIILTKNDKWKAVRYGLELALGKSEIDPKYFD